MTAESIHARLLAAVARVLRAAGWRVARPARRAHGPSADLIASSPERRYAIELKVARETRRELLEGQLAAAILRARAVAPALAAQPLAVVGAAAISEPLLQALRDFASRYGAGTPWGVVDSRGLVELHGPGLDETRRRGEQPATPRPASSFDPFSDRGQWMLKVLVNHRLPAELRVPTAGAAATDGPVATAAELAARAGVSVPVAARLVAHLRREHFIAPGRPLELVRADELLHRWRAANLRPRVELRARWLFTAGDSFEQLKRVLAPRVTRPGERACLGLFAATALLGFPFVTGVAPHLYLEDVSARGLKTLGLVRTEPGEAAAVLVRQPRFRESVFRGARPRDGVPAADIVQCWLDTADYPARGEEMAALLYRRVIGPALEGRR